VPLVVSTGSAAAAAAAAAAEAAIEDEEKKAPKLALVSSMWELLAAVVSNALKEQRANIAEQIRAPLEEELKLLASSSGTAGQALGSGLAYLSNAVLGRASAPAPTPTPQVATVSAVPAPVSTPAPVSGSG